jgi:hypothetical protein
MWQMRAPPTLYIHVNPLLLRVSARPPSRSRARAIEQAPARLSDLDCEILETASAMRVVTQTQLERLHPVVPGRTMRYRTSRLHQLRLLGRTRPYRDSGSAPQHWWPTRRGDALIRGQAPPRRGERRTPNPLTLSHNAAISELYVVLATQAEEAGLKFVGIDREADAREAFKDPGGRERAIAPDLLIELRDRDGRRLLAHVEIDLGTMSHPRLRTKLEGYLAYSEQHAWQTRHPFAPALLLITTSRPRAHTFVGGARRLLGSKRWRGNGGELVLGVCARARHLDGLPAARCWAAVAADEPLTLSEVVAAARRPHDEQQAQDARLRDELQQERGRLTRDPGALRQHLRDQAGLRRVLAAQLDLHHHVTLDLLLDRREKLDVDERDALHALGRGLADVLPADYRTTTIPELRHHLLNDLAEHYQHQQLDEIGRLARDLGDGPHLRHARDHLQSGKLLNPAAIRQVAIDARHDRDTYQDQARLRSAYVAHRDQEARARSRDAGLSSRLRRRPETHHHEIDTEALRSCGHCRETIHPPRAQTTSLLPANACPFCDATTPRPAKRSETAQ